MALAGALVNRDDLRAVWADVQANRQRLEACPGHQFELPAEVGTNLLRVRCRCSVCGGEEDLGRVSEGAVVELHAAADPSLVDQVATFDAVLDAAWARHRARSGATP